MTVPFRWEINVMTGERKRIDLTPMEITDAQQRKAAEDAANAIEDAKDAAMQAVKDALKLDPTKKVSVQDLIDLELL